MTKLSTYICSKIIDKLVVKHLNALRVVLLVYQHKQFKKKITKKDVYKGIEFKVHHTKWQVICQKSTLINVCRKEILQSTHTQFYG